MNVLTNFFFGPAIVFEARDLKLKLINHIDDPLLYGVKETLYLSVPCAQTGASLTDRVHGALNIPKERIMLFYCGSLLTNNTPIAEEAYELTSIVSEDMEIFRPRIHVLLRKKEETETNVVLIHRRQSEDDAELAEKAALEAFRLEQERQNLERQILINQLRLQRDAEREAPFDLTAELSKINCSFFYNLLKENGYEDAGAFASLTDVPLQALHIPKKARVRIVALAAHFRHRIDHFKGQRGGVRRLSKTGHNHGTIALTATSGHLQQQLRQARERRVHSDAIQHKIDAIRRAAVVDEYGVPIAVDISEMTKAPDIFCCIKHTEYAQQSRAAYFQQRRNFNANRLTVLMAEMDKSFVSRSVLEVVLRNQLADRRYPVQEEAVAALLDRCVMSPSEQMRRKQWTMALCERSVSFRPSVGDGSSVSQSLPVALYDTKVFIEEVVRLLHCYDMDRYA